VIFEAQRQGGHRGAQGASHGGLLRDEENWTQRLKDTKIHKEYK
jgi:hypothetical protein